MCKVQYSRTLSWHLLLSLPGWISYSFSPSLPHPCPEAPFCGSDIRKNMSINKAELCGDQARTTSPRFPFRCSSRFNLTTRNQHNTWRVEVKPGTHPQLPWLNTGEADAGCPGGGPAHPCSVPPHICSPWMAALMTNSGFKAPTSHRGHSLAEISSSASLTAPF